MDLIRQQGGQKHGQSLGTWSRCVGDAHGSDMVAGVQLLAVAYHALCWFQGVLCMLLCTFVVHHHQHHRVFFHWQCYIHLDVHAKGRVPISVDSSCFYCFSVVNWIFGVLNAVLLMFEKLTAMTAS